MNEWSKDGKSRRKRILLLLTLIFGTSVFLFFSLLLRYIGPSFMSSAFYAVEWRFFQGQSRLYSQNGSPGPTRLTLGLHGLVFMLSELILLALQTAHALTLCCVDQFKRFQRFSSPDDEKYSSIVHTVNFNFELVSLLFDLVSSGSHWKLLDYPKEGNYIFYIAS